MNQPNNPPETSSEKDNSQNEKISSKSDKTIDTNNPKQKKQLSEFEISQLSFKNEKLNEEVKSLKAQIINLNDKINEQMITITNNKLLYDKETNSTKDKYTKEIKSLKEKLDNSNTAMKTLENQHKIRIYEIENEKKLLYELNSKISQTSHEYESQILIINDSKKRAISDYENQIEELKKKFENMQSNNIEIESKLKTQEQLVEFAKMDQEDIKFRLENELKELTAKYDALVKKAENDKKKSKTQLEMKK